MHNHEAWLIKAQSDLISSKKLFSDTDDRTLDGAVYHTQQCAEKALKAFLVFKQQPIFKTHDLERLIELCSAIDTTFKDLLSAAAILNPYATEFRYPDDLLFPEREEVEEAIKYAESILSFVQKKIS